jgi:3',5'-cyclic AMP phosphodiesterase CpdA
MRIIHISDFHLPGSARQKVEGVYPHRHLQAAVEEIRRQKPQPDLVVLGGDLLNNGKQGKYQDIRELFASLNVPVHAVLGNHDELESFQKTFAEHLRSGGSGYYSFDQEDQHIILLRSAGTGRGHGEMDEEQLLWLNEDMRQNQKKSTLIFMHHPPVDIGIPWLDKIRLINADEFWRILPPHAQNIRGVFVAHLHIQMSCLSHSVLVASPPAVCFQFRAHSEAAKAEQSDELPGFNLIDISPEQLSLRTVRFSLSEPEAKPEPEPEPE